MNTTERPTTSTERVQYVAHMQEMYDSVADGLLAVRLARQMEQALAKIREFEEHKAMLPEEAIDDLKRILEGR